MYLPSDESAVAPFIRQSPGCATPSLSGTREALASWLAVGDGPTIGRGDVAFFPWLEILDRQKELLYPQVSKRRHPLVAFEPILESVVPDK